MDNSSKMMALIVGLFIGLVLVLVVVRFLNKDGKVKTKYDERQHLVRGRGYMYSFWTLVILMVIKIFLDAFEYEIPAKSSVVYFVMICIAIMVHTVYCIFNDGYFGINNTPRGYYIFFLIIGIFNLFIGVMNAKTGRMITDGKLDFPVANFVCGLMFVVLGISVIIKKLVKKDIDEEDDDDDDDNEEGGL